MPSNTRSSGADRVILVRVQAEYVNLLGFKDPALEYVRSSFIIFREGQFKSLQIHVHRDSQISIEILPADARYSVPLPANPVSLADGGLPSHYARPDEAMLAGRPLKTLQTRKPVKTCLYKCRQPISHSSPSTSAPIPHALPPTLLFSPVPIYHPKRTQKRLYGDSLRSLFGFPLKSVRFRANDDCRALTTYFP